MCIRDRDDLVADSDAIFLGGVIETYPSEGYAWQNVSVHYLAKSPFGKSGIGDRIVILQDLSREPLLEDGAQYYLFVQYHPWQVTCGSQGIFQVDRTTVSPLAQNPLWSGGDLGEFQELLLK